MARGSYKTEVFEKIFEALWDDKKKVLKRTVVMRDEVGDHIRAYNKRHGTDHKGAGNPSNFVKDFIRKRASFNRNWPTSILKKGFTMKQVTGKGRCFEFIPLAPGQTQAAPGTAIPVPSGSPHLIQSLSLPLATRRLGRRDEPWLTQVAVRLRLLETHFAVGSAVDLVNIDHLQMNIKLAKTEVDSLYLGTLTGGSEAIITCEAKGKADDILVDQIVQQARAVFSLPAIDQPEVIPTAIKVVGNSRVQFVEFDRVPRSRGGTLKTLTIAQNALYEFFPPVEGIK